MQLEAVFTHKWRWYNIISPINRNFNFCIQVHFCGGKSCELLYPTRQIVAQPLYVNPYIYFHFAEFSNGRQLVNYRSDHVFRDTESVVYVSIYIHLHRFVFRYWLSLSKPTYERLGFLHDIIFILTQIFISHLCEIQPFINYFQKHFYIEDKYLGYCIPSAKMSFPIKFRTLIGLDVIKYPAGIQ